MTTTTKPRRRRHTTAITLVELPATMSQLAAEAWRRTIEGRK